jgi:hypothetical protein
VTLPLADWSVWIFQQGRAIEEINNSDLYSEEESNIGWQIEGPTRVQQLGNKDQSENQDASAYAHTSFVKTSHKSAAVCIGH